MITKFQARLSDMEPGTFFNAQAFVGRAVNCNGRTSEGVVPGWLYRATFGTVWFPKRESGWHGVAIGPSGISQVALDLNTGEAGSLTVQTGRGRYRNAKRS